jgi:D-alanyl-D-alanine-carboxypeptidase/D-alanyl-D-alanine-endopeptidase
LKLLREARAAPRGKEWSFNGMYQGPGGPSRAPRVPCYPSGETAPCKAPPGPTACTLWYAMPPLLLLLPLALGSAPPGAATSQEPDGDFAAVDSFLARELPKDGGGVLRVAQPARVLFLKAYGGYRLDDALPLAGGTQLLSVVVLLHLVDAQKLALDAPVSSVLRDWPKDKGAITLRMLLAHTSGLPPSAECLDDRNTTLEACVRQIAAVPLRKDPGTAVLFGGTGFQVAGRMAEVATGKSWADLFREHLTGPLALKATGFGRSANPRVAGGAQSTAGEYGRVLDLLIQGGETAGVRILNPASVDAMFQDQSGGAPLVQSPYALLSGREASRPGLGLWLDGTDGHGRGVEAVCQGTFGFTAWVDRDRQLGGVLLVQSDLRRVVPLEQEIRAQFRKAVPPAALNH